eukprot:UN26791
MIIYKATFFRISLQKSWFSVDGSYNNGNSFCCIYSLKIASTGMKQEIVIYIV